MSCSITDKHNFIVCELEPEANCAQGIGAAERAILMIRFKVLLRGPKEKGRGYYFRTLQCRLSPFDATYLADSHPFRLNICVVSGEQSPNNHAYIEIPLTREQLSVLERLRKSNDVRLRLDFDLAFEELVQLTASQEHGRSIPVWGLREYQQRQGQCWIDIPRSTWVDQILPQLGFDKIHLIELPAIPLAEVASLQKAFDALKEAQQHHRHGFYNAAVVNCRQALDSLLTAQMEIVDDGGNQRKVPALDERWKVRLGQGTFDWLNEAMASVKRAGNDAAHRSRNNFDQFESQMIQAITTTLIAYAARAREEGTNQ